MLAAKRCYSLVGTGTGTLSTPMTRLIVDTFIQQCFDVFRPSFEANIGIYSTKMRGESLG